MADRHQSAITLFVEDVGAAKELYSAAFRLPVHFEDAVPDGIAVDPAVQLRAVVGL